MSQATTSATATTPTSADPEQLEPGSASGESMLITTDSLEEFSHQMSTEMAGTNTAISSSDLPSSSSLQDLEAGLASASIVDKEAAAQEDSAIIPDINPQPSDPVNVDNDTTTVDVLSSNVDSDDYLHNAAWLGQSDHVFVLSTSGKPIYTLHGNEDKLASLFGVMQALVSVVQSNNNDIIQSVQAVGMQIVFLVRPPLILVAVSKMRLSVQQIQMELTDVYNQILSTLTLSTVSKILEERKNFDLRRWLGGSERLINNLVMHRTQRTGCPTQRISNKPFTFLTNSVRILPLSSTIRDSITAAIQASCSKIKNLLFAVLLANGRLITLVRLKKYFLHPADLRLMFNLIECSESFKTAESWTPICLPKFNANGFLYAHVSYLSDDCQACLLLFTVEQTAFFALAEAKRKITEKLRRTQCLKAINDAMTRTISLRTIGIPEMRHFLYKSKSNAQLLCADIGAPYTHSAAQFGRLEGLYYGIHQRIHNGSRPVKLIFEASEREVMLGWVTTGYELYATFEPLVSKGAIITLVNKLLFWIKREEDSLFILNAPTF